MPNDATNAAIWQTAGQTLNTAANAMATSNLNKKTRAYNSEWAYRQREWALQDWQMQNEYNSPKAQRQRMIEANINPALMYGSGASGGASQPVRTTQSPQWNPKTPEYNLNAGSSIMTYLGVQKQVAEIEQMKIQNRLLEEQITNKRVDTDIKTALAGLRGIDYDVAKKAYDEGLLDANALSAYQIQQTRAEILHNDMLIRKIQAEYTTEQIVTTIAQTRANTAVTEARRDEILQNLENLKKTGILQQFKITGEEFLNNKFSSPALKILLAILQKL